MDQIEKRHIDRDGKKKSMNDVWATPQALFNRLNAQHHFTCDVCALPDNAKVSQYFSPEQDGLKQEWHGVCWCNPPYGRAITAWVKKALLSVTIGEAEKVVMLLPAKTDTKWFHEYILPFGSIEFIKGRLRFGEAKHNAMFPSMIVVFERRNHDGR